MYLHEEIEKEEVWVRFSLTRKIKALFNIIRLTPSQPHSSHRLSNRFHRWVEGTRCEKHEKKGDY